MSALDYEFSPERERQRALVQHKHPDCRCEHCVANEQDYAAAQLTPEWPLDSNGVPLPGTLKARSTRPT